MTERIPIKEETIAAKAPVVLFVYNRPRHTRQTVEALLANAEAAQTPLHIFSDAPKDAAANRAVAEVRSYIRTIAGFQSVTIVERETNLGLARSIVDGVTQICQSYGRVIVLEDDIATSPYFLKFMNEALDLYAHDERVISIHGYVYPVSATMPETFFLRGADCWGWATWKRGWQLFEPDGAKLLAELHRQKITRQFDFDGAYSYTGMLEDQVAGRNQSWAIRWHAAAFLANRLTLYPGGSLIQNIGNDKSGTHCSKTDDFSAPLTENPINVTRIPLEENAGARAAFVHFWRSHQGSLMRRAARRIRRAIGA